MADRVAIWQMPGVAIPAEVSILRDQALAFLDSDKEWADKYGDMQLYKQVAMQMYNPPVDELVSGFFNRPVCPMQTFEKLYVHNIYVLGSWPLSPFERSLIRGWGNIGVNGEIISLENAVDRLASICEKVVNRQPIGAKGLRNAGPLFVPILNRMVLSNNHYQHNPNATAGEKQQSVDLLLRYFMIVVYLEAIKFLHPEGISIAWKSKTVWTVAAIERQRTSQLVTFTRLRLVIHPLFSSIEEPPLV